MKIFLVLLVCLPSLLWAQKIDQLAAFRDIDSERYFKFHYDNDYFAASDKNYTQGYVFELVAPYFKTNPANYLFAKPKESSYKYSLSVEHIGFTPNHYERAKIQFGDRPFAAAIMLKSSSIATNVIRRSRLVSSFSIGLIGPGAFGEEMQVGIHKATGNKIPLGWRHQIKNDIVLNYEIGYEKQLLKYNDLVSLQANSSMKLGSLFTNASVGVNATLGIINEPFTSKAIKKKGIKMYLYGQSNLNLIGYDATLQGGVFNRKSPYTIESDAIERLTAQFNYGLIVQTRTLYFEYTRSVITPEFETGSIAKWGGIKIGFTL